jgi:16S rRNA (guanine(966)-N(2))-methyltransferase RsmD
MRITGGELRGRRLKTPSTAGLRPTQDSVREAVFSMLADIIAGSRFLDLFAGTGAVGLEAFSRGATSVVWVEKEPKAFRILQENIAALAGENLWHKANCADVFAWLKNTHTQKFDIIYADPPYDSDSSPDRTAEIMAALAASGVVAERGVFLAEQRSNIAAPCVDGWEPITERRYGRTKIMIFRKC